MGILENGKLSISKKPLPIKLNTLYWEKKWNIENLDIHQI